MAQALPPAGSHNDVLLRRFLDMDGDAWLLVAAWARAVLRKPSKRLPRDDEDELIASAVLELWTTVSKPGFQCTRSLAGLTKCIVGRRFIDHIRKKRPMSELVEGLVGVDDNIVARLGTQELRQHMRDLVPRLPRRRRQVVELMMENRSYGEIGARLGIRPANARLNVWLAVQQLRGWLGLSET